MDSDIVDKVSQVLNPVSQKTLGEEGRIISVEKKGEDLHIRYKRDGIPPQQKQELEKSIIDMLKDKISEDNIFLLSSSDSSQDVAPNLNKEAVAPKNPAQLKVGHGTVGEKRKIPNVKNVICVASGKGGVGKSTFTSNLAVTLAAKGKKVGIIDADIYGPSVPLLFNRREHRPSANEEQKIMPLENHGIKFISFGNFIHEDEPVVWRGPMLGGVLNQFFFETEWGELDYLLLDLPPGTGDVQLSMVQNIELSGAIIISTPQDIALLDARKALHMFDKLDVHVIGMVENMSSFICDGCGKEHFLYGTGGVMSSCTELGVGYLGQIPLDIGLRKGADFGTPYMTNSEKHGDTKVWTAYQDIGGKLDSYFYPDDNKKKSLLGKLFN